MATTTANFVLSSSDIDSSPLSVNASTTLYKAGLTTGVDQTSGMNRKIILAADITKQQLIPTILGGTFTVKGASYASSGSAVITHTADSTVTRKIGQAVFGTGVPAGATITSVDSTIQFTLTANTTVAVGSGEGSLTVGYNQYTANKANKVYICNSSTSNTDYVEITIDAEAIGRLYAGDWMLMPWSASTDASNIYVTAATQTSTSIIDWMVIGEGDAA